MQDFEKLGVFYLGREYDLATRECGRGLVLYDSRDLVTHAVCIGMTGSGKTGLGVVLLEEAAIDDIPAIVIDPKGDLANLMLTFPDLRPDDFLPWINSEDAQNRGASLQEYAASQAAMWKRGLSDWGEDGERVRRLKEAAEVVVYTPGSSAGVPVSILKSFAAPDATVRDDAEMLGERVVSTVIGLLALLGIDADPLQSRDHILLSTILTHAWKQGDDVDLAALIQAIQTPPFTKVGVLDLETFYPSKDRFGLVMAINNMLAAPGFEAWMEGEPLDVDRMLHTSQGKPRIAIFSIAHLNDPARMFFVSLLLNQIVGWMRAQQGTSSLRAVLYMDEIFGYFPPVANPPSKVPLLTLLKQGRAFGLGVVLATQNPVDLDYKGLSNTGTWFIGRLQTDRDKQRVIDGLEGAAAGSASGFNRHRMEQILAGLGSRVFLMNNVHEDAPVVFQTRWTLSYLRGPVTRDQIRELMRDRPASANHPGTGSAAPVPARVPGALPSGKIHSATARPTLDPGVTQVFVPVRGKPASSARLVYRPALLGCARVRFSDAKAKVDAIQEKVFVTPFTDDVVPVDWEKAQGAGIAAGDLENAPREGAVFADVPAAAGKPQNYAAWGRDFALWLYGTQSMGLLFSPGIKAYSMAGEEERDFRIRLQQAAREERDRMVEQIRRKYAPRVSALQDRIRRAEEAVARERAQSRQSQFQTAISFGSTLLGAMLGRKAVSASTLGRATTAARGVGRTLKEGKDVGRAEDNVTALQQQLADMNAEAEAAAAELQSRIDPQNEPLDAVSIRPRKSDISVQLVALAWMPFLVEPDGTSTPSW